MIAPIELEKLEECRSLLEEIPLPRTCFLLSLTPPKKGRILLANPMRGIFGPGLS